VGDLIALLERLNLSPLNSLILAVILWLVWRLYQRFELLEGQCGTIQQIREHLAEHDTQIAVASQRICALEDRQEER
jgi:hypothetical protein